MINVPQLQGQHVRIPTREKLVDWCYRVMFLGPGRVQLALEGSMVRIRSFARATLF